MVGQAVGQVHVIGAGMAGLSAAVRLSKAGVKVSLYDTAKHAGGRCRSFYDETLNATIDNGTHLLLSGNHEVLDYVDLCGSGSMLNKMPCARFDFHDVSTGSGWHVDLGAMGGRVSLIRWLLDRRHQPPGLKPLSFLKDVWALQRGQGRSVAACLDPSSQTYRNFWRPMCLAVLNVEPNVGAARMMWAVLRETVLKGGAFAKPVFAPKGLGGALVDPALEVLRGCGADLHFQHRITALDCGDEAERVKALRIGNAFEVLGDGDAVILAVPHHAVKDLITGITTPEDTQAVLNVHYRVGTTMSSPRMLGLVNGEAEWVFQRGNIVSVTISAANAWMSKDADAIAHGLWPEVSKAMGEGEAGNVPPYRVIKERRATFVATPDALAKRPQTNTHLSNLYMAGDWTDTGLPASLEGAVKSGRLAAEAVLRRCAARP